MKREFDPLDPLARHRSGGRFWICDSIIDRISKVIGSDAFHVYAVVCRHASSESAAFLFPHTIVEKTGLSLNTVKKALLLLSAYQLISWERSQKNHALALVVEDVPVRLKMGSPQEWMLSDTGEDNGEIILPRFPNRAGANTDPNSQLIPPREAAFLAKMAAKRSSRGDDKKAVESSRGDDQKAIESSRRDDPLRVKELREDKTSARRTELASESEFFLISPEPETPAKQPAEPNASAVFLSAFTARNLTPPTLLPRHHKNLKDYRTAVAPCGKDFSLVCAGFLANEWAKAQGYDVGIFTRATPEKWLVTAEMPQAQTPAAPPTAEELEEQRKRWSAERLARIAAEQAQVKPVMLNTHPCAAERGATRPLRPALRATGQYANTPPPFASIARTAALIADRNRPQENTAETTGKNNG